MARRESAADPWLSQMRIMTTHKVVIYLTGWCPYCARALDLLQSKGIEPECIDIEERPQARAEMIARSGRRSVPQIFIGERHVGGCDDLYALEAEGGLNPLLQSGA
jgi:glutaredoxin 3